MSNDPAYTVAVFNASDDTLEMLAVSLAHRDYRPVMSKADHVISGELNFIAFLKTHTPDALIWDVAPPYDRSWNFVQLIRDLRQLEHCAIVLTTTHKVQLDSLAGRDTGAIEVVGKRYDTSVIVEAVTHAIEQRHSAHARIFGQSREW